MNYQELASKLNRPYNTVRKWRGEITKISGYEFKRIKTRNRRGIKNKLVYDFDNDELDCFIEISESLNSGKTLKQAITEIFGNLEDTERKNKLDRDKVQDRKIIVLNKKINVLQTELDSLSKTSSAQAIIIKEYENRLQALEQPKGMKKLFK